jgi:hypothetical protein
MTLKELTLWGERDKVAVSIERLRMFEPPEGYSAGGRTLAPSRYWPTWQASSMTHTITSRRWTHPS